MPRKPCEKVAFLQGFSLTSKIICHKLKLLELCEFIREGESSMEKRIVPLPNGQKQDSGSYPLHESIDRWEKDTFLSSSVPKKKDLGLKVGSGLKLVEEDICFSQLLEEIKEIIQGDLRKKRLTFDFDISQIENQYIEADRLRLKQILLNVLSNAVKFNRQGGKVSLRVRELNKARNGYGVYEFRIKDTGIGMHKEFIYKVFSADHSGSMDQNDDVPGTGFGIIKKLVDRMGGTIAVSSRLGRGTEFIILLWFSLSDKNQPLLAGERPVRSKVVKSMTAGSVTLKLLH